MNINKKLIRDIALGVVGVGIGYGIGYYTTRGRFQRQADKDIESVREEYKRFFKTEEFETPTSAAKAMNIPIVARETFKPSRADIDAAVVKGRIAYHKITQVEGYGEPETSETDELKMQESILESEENEPAPEMTPEIQMNNVFTNARNEEEPHLIRPDEFDEDNGYEKISVSYFEGDDTLISDDNGMPIEDEDLIGTYNLTMFGKLGDMGETDPEIIHVRNMQLHVDFEVSHDNKSYVEAMHGVKPETPRHIDRFREGDDG